MPRRLAMGSVVVVVALWAATAAAQQPPGQAEPQVMKEATALFMKGSELYGKKSYAEALAALQRSHELVPSPNSSLFIARCLRDMGRKAEAAAAYEEVQREASAKTGAGENKYEETAKAPASEGAEVRASLGTLSIRVAHLPADGKVLVDGAPVPAKDGNARAYHAPGSVTVTVRAPPAPDVVKQVSVRAGETTDVDVDAAAPPPPRKRPGWMVPALAATGGVGVVGIAMAIGFGVSSRSTFSDLQSSCGSRCFSPSQQDQISSGKGAQTGANVSLAIGLLGVAGAATVGILLFRDSRAGSTSASIQVGPGHAALVGRF